MISWCRRLTGRRKASATKTLECSDRNACDVELLTVGGFSPLRGFMHQEDYDAVVSGHRLASGQLFGLPIVMDTDRDDVVVGDKLLLTYKGQDLAVLHVEDKWEPNKVVEATGLLRHHLDRTPGGAHDHHGAQALLSRWQRSGP